MKLRKYFVITKMSIANSLTYRANIVSRLCFYTMFIYIFMNLWKAIYSGGGVQGYSHCQIVWYLVLTEFISFSSRTNIHSTISSDVKSGGISYQIGRPVHYILLQFATSLGQLIVNALMFGGFAVILGFVFVGKLPSFTFYELPALFVSLILSTLINYFFLMLIGLTAFVIEDNFAIFLIYQKIGFLLGMFLPIEFLPLWLQPIAKVLPFASIFWAPAKIFVNYSPSIVREILPMQFLWCVVSIFLVFFCYNRSAKKLQVNGG